MAKKTGKPESIEIKGKLVFDKIDSARVRLKLEEADGLVVKTVLLERDIFPADFEQPRYEVKGAYAFKLQIKDTLE